jgi:hypothetical protein
MVGGHLGMNRTYDRIQLYYMARHETGVTRIHKTM